MLQSVYVKKYNTQESIDNMFEVFCSTLKNEMDLKLRERIMNVSNADDNKKRKRGKPWWNDELSTSWNTFCEAEKGYTKANSHVKHKLRSIMKSTQKNFDHAVRCSKQRFWVAKRTEILDLCDTDSGTYWKKIGKIGVANDRNARRPQAVVTDKGVINDSEEGYLKVWKDTICQPFNELQFCSQR